MLRHLLMKISESDKITLSLPPGMDEQFLNKNKSPPIVAIEKA